MPDDPQILKNPESTPEPTPMSLEKHQPDPMLQMSTGRIGAGGLSLVALIIAVILGVVFYGLNSPTISHEAAAAPTAKSAAPPPGTAAPAAPHNGKG
jgi:uncharacterized protein HemX